jgi:hypothetical protein
MCTYKLSTDNKRKGFLTLEKAKPGLTGHDIGNSRLAWTFGPGFQVRKGKKYTGTMREARGDLGGDSG